MPPALHRVAEAPPESDEHRPVALLERGELFVLTASGLRSLDVLSDFVSPLGSLRKTPEEVSG
jgi:hypothetical protein